MLILPSCNSKSFGSIRKAPDAKNLDQTFEILLWQWGCIGVDGDIAICSQDLRLQLHVLR